MPLAVQCATSPQLFERKRLKDIPNRQLRLKSAYAQILPVLGVLERKEKDKCACPVQFTAGRDVGKALVLEERSLPVTFFP